MATSAVPVERTTVPRPGAGLFEYFATNAAEVTVGKPEGSENLMIHEGKPSEGSFSIHFPVKAIF